jgi:hypothetical protein
VLLAGGLPAVQAASASATAPLLEGGGPTLTAPADIRALAGGPESSPLPYVVLQWTAIPNADHYVVQMSPNEDWTNNSVDLPGSGTSMGTTYEVPMTLPYAAYFWRVRGVAADGSQTDWSADSAFFHSWPDTVAITHAPTDADPTFAWTPVKFASAYVLQIAPNTSFNPDERKDCLVNHPSYTPYDSVGGEDPTAGGCFSLASLKGTSNAGTCTATYSPSADTGTTFNGTVTVKNTDTLATSGWQVTLTWPGNQQTGTFTNATGSQTGAVTTASSSGGNGALAPGASTPFSFNATYTGTNSVPTLACTSTPAAGSSTTWYWKVRALDVTSETPINADTAPRLTTGCDALNRNCGPWTLGGSFTFTDPGPGGSAPGSVSGLATNCSSTCNDSPTLTWTPVGGARAYRVRLALDSLWLNAQREYLVVGNSFTPRDSYLDNQAGLSYHWVVSACADLLGKACGPASPASTFVKRSNPVTLTSPAAGATVNTPVFTLRWSDYFLSGGAPRAEAKAYHLQISADPTFQTGVFQTKVDHTQFTRPDATFADGRLYWRVQAIDGSDHPLTWSATQTFIKDSQPPIAKLRLPLELAGYNFIDFSEAVTGVDSSTVGIMVAGGGRVSGSVFVTDPKTAVFVPTTPLTAGEKYVAWVTSGVKDIVGNGGVADPTVVDAPLVVDSGGGDIQENWDSDINAAASGNHYIQSSMSGAQLDVPFTGSSVALYGSRAKDGGYATLKIDGTTYATVSFFATTRQWQRQLFATSGLSSGFHHLTLVVSGRAPGGSLGANVYVDGFRTNAGHFEENSSRVMQWWSKRRATDAVGSNYDTTTYAAAGDTGSRPSSVASVKGSSVALVGCKSPDSGKVAVVLDGSTVATVDLYQSYTSCGVRLYSHYLTGGAHTVRLVSTAARNTRSTGNRVSIDVIKVSP